MKPDSNPPRLAEWLLHSCAPVSLRDAVLGDLEEEWREAGPSAAWYWRESLALSARFLLMRFFDAVHRRNRGLPRIPEPSKGDGLMERIWTDLRYGLRVLGKTPAFTVVALLTLALGIGANTAIFSVVNAVLIQPLPLPESGRLVTIRGVNKEGRQQWFSHPDFLELRQGAVSLASVTAFVGQSVNLTGTEEPQRVRGGFVSDTFFKVAGVEPAIGRGFLPGVDDKEGAERVCIVQYETWQTVFGGNPKLLGSTLQLNNEPFTVVGILPAGFRFPFDEIEVWMPHHHWPVFRSYVRDGRINNRAAGLIGPIARLKPGVSIQQAQTEMKALAARQSQAFPEAGERSAVVASLQAGVVEGLEQPLWVLMGAVGFVLLIACANVANLMLGRAAARKREIATRAALGAARGRLVRQLLTETGLLWGGGCLLGFLAGGWGLQMLLLAAPNGLPGGIVPHLDTTVFLFAVALTGMTGLLFGMIPALRFSNPNLMETLKEGGRTNALGVRTRLRGMLVVSQVALTVILLAGAGLMYRSFERLSSVDPGFRPDHLLTMEYRLPANKYPQTAQQWETHRRIIERVREVPGVRAAALIRGLPFSGNGGTVTYEIPGQPMPPGETRRARSNAADTHYFATMGIPLLQGRNFTEQDQAATEPVAVISRRMAEQNWPGRDPIGQTVFVLPNEQRISVKVVGVVGDTKQYALDEGDLPYIYVPQTQNIHIFNTIAARTEGDPMQLSNAVRSAVWSVDPDQPVWKVRTQESLIEGSVGLPRFLMKLMGAYAALALLLAAVGLYGVMAYNVAQRTQEIGVRIALGAQRGDVLRLVLRRGLLFTGLGLVVGLAGALALGRVVQTMLYKTSASEPFTLAVVSIVLTGVAVLAAYLPARRATRVDPVIALRYE